MDQAMDWGAQSSEVRVQGTFEQGALVLGPVLGPDMGLDVESDRVLVSACQFGT